MGIKDLHHKFTAREYPEAASLLLRVSLGSMMLFGHGLDKLSHFSDKVDKFPDPLEIGSSLSLSIATFTEFFCALAIIIGIWTRYASTLVMLTMGTAAFIFHGDHPFKTKELAMVYFFGFLAVSLMGPGKFSVDQQMK